MKLNFEFWSFLRPLFDESEGTRAGCVMGPLVNYLRLFISASDILNVPSSPMSYFLLHFWVLYLFNFLAQGNNGGLWWGSNPRPPHYESDVQLTASRHPFKIGTICWSSFFDAAKLFWSMLCSLMTTSLMIQSYRFDYLWLISNRKYNMRSNMPKPYTHALTQARTHTNTSPAKSGLQVWT